ncbi:MAG: hypothetical protein AAFY41_11790, partial [Bacteroidota bacterium]
RRKLLLWEIGSFIFIGLFGAGLHFVLSLTAPNHPIGDQNSDNSNTKCKPAPNKPINMKDPISHRRSFLLCRWNSWLITVTP